MASTIDRFVLEKDSDGRRVKKGWRVQRYSFGHTVIQHLRTGASRTGVIDDFGNIQYATSYLHAAYAFDHEELVPFYK